MSDHGKNDYNYSDSNYAQMSAAYSNNEWKLYLCCVCCNAERKVCVLTSGLEVKMRIMSIYTSNQTLDIWGLQI